MQRLKITALIQLIVFALITLILYIKKVNDFYDNQAQKTDRKNSAQSEMTTLGCDKKRDDVSDALYYAKAIAASGLNFQGW